MLMFLEKYLIFDTSKLADSHYNPKDQITYCFIKQCQGCQTLMSEKCFTAYGCLAGLVRWSQ